MLLDSLLASRSFYDLSFAPFHTLCPFFYDSFGLPPHPYLHASSAFLAVVQLYVRSAQLLTNVPLTSRFGDRSAFCHFGCLVLEDPHHIFVLCLAFQDLHDDYLRLLILDVSHCLSGTTLPPSVCSHIDHIITHLFRDDDPWPLGSSLFYLELLPPLLPHPRHCPTLGVDAHHLLVRVAHSCHTSAIHLTGCIWGSVLWCSTLTTSPLSCGSDLGPQGHDLVLPPHLHRLFPS